MDDPVSIRATIKHVYESALRACDVHISLEKEARARRELESLGLRGIGVLTVGCFGLNTSWHDAATKNQYQSLVI